MFKILDLYIFRRYLKTFIFTVCILVAVLIVIDMTEKIEDFNRMKISAWQIFKEYYLNFIPYYANMLSPIIVFIAAVFVTANLASHTEIVAMISSGMSLKRILFPYFIASLVVAIAVFFLLNWVIPNANKVRINFENNYIRQKFYFNKQNIHLKIAPKVYVYLMSYDNISNIGYRFTMEKFEGTTLEQKLESSRIVWDSTKRKWRVDDYKLRLFKDNKEMIIYARAIDTALNLRPKDFQSTYMLNEQLTLTELNEYIDQLKLRGADNIETYLVERYERFTYPFAIIILTIIGVIVSARKTREGSGLQIAFGFVLAFIYIFFIVVSRGIGQQGNLNPLLAAWLPNIVFCLVGIIMYIRIPK